MKNIAVIGTGYWGKNLVRNFYALDALHTLCDINPETVLSFCEQYPGVNGVTSFAEVLSMPDIRGIA
ncbi:MAG: oxidoreductase, partial [Candidatus Electrothrix sp. AR3]|nr:oxidoreductase [Candidatus Electrothrix sp. AR3]